MDKQYRILQDKYNIAVAKAQDLQEQIAAKEEQWGEWKRDVDVLKKNTKDLCEQILAKDRRQTNVGKQKAWDEMGADELVSRASEAFPAWIREFTRQMESLINANEERRQENEDLERRLSIALTSGGSGLSREDLDAIAERESEKAAATENGSPEFVEKAERGAIDAITEEASDYTPADEMENEEVRLTACAPPVRREGRRKKKDPPVSVDMDDWEERLREEEWCLILTIGAKGYSQYKDMYGYISGKYPDMGDSRLKAGLKTLVTAGAVHMEKNVKTPLASMNVYCLTQIGAQLYAGKSGKKAVRSELELALSEHTSAAHGFSIFAIADALRKTGEFSSVEDKNRRRAIKLGDGSEYVPDIVCTRHDGQKLYIEYEMGSTKENEFARKCNKMSGVTHALLFMVPDRPTANWAAERVAKWIDTRGAAALGSVTVKICAAKKICTGSTSLSNDKAWEYAFRPGENGKEPVWRN